MAEGISPINGEQVNCRFHENETYQLYCKDCKDFVCFECLSNLHHQHNFCRLQDAENEIRTQLQCLIENNIIKTLKEKCDNKLEELKQTLTKIVTEIEAEFDSMRKQQVLSIKQNFKEFAKSIEETRTRVDIIQGQTSTGDANIQIGLFETVQCLSDITNISHIAEEKFEGMVLSEQKQNNTILSLGYFHKLAHNDESRGLNTEDRCDNANVLLQDSTSNTVSTQTDSQCDVDSDTDLEWFDADEPSEEDNIENSSDEVSNNYPTKIICGETIKVIDRVVPISKEDAWILANRKLYKISEFVFNDTIYADGFDDIEVLKNGNVLLLCRTNCIIMQLLPDRRIVRFANAGQDELIMPYCFRVKTNDTVVTVLKRKEAIMHGGYWKHNYVILYMDSNGVEINRKIFYRNGGNIPRSVEDTSHVSYVDFRYSYTSTTSFINVIKTDGSTMQNNFCGAFGFNPAFDFQCFGICCDNNENILVSDYNHHTVYVLSKELKYSRCVVDANDGLSKPTAIALFGSSLWIADEGNIFIFQYSGNEI